MKLDKNFIINKLLPILVTSILSALVSMLQATLAQYTATNIPAGSPETSAIVGGALMSLRVLKCAV